MKSAKIFFVSQVLGEKYTETGVTINQTCIILIFGLLVKNESENFPFFFFKITQHQGLFLVYSGTMSQELTKQFDI